MAKILLLFSTTDGQTQLIVEKISFFCKVNNDVTVKPLRKFNYADLINYDKVVLGASIRYGKHQDEVDRFIKSKLPLLQEKISFFFSVNVVARKPNKNSPHTNPYMKKFLKKLNWHPSHTEVFAGKVDYPSYGFFDKHIIRFIMWITKGPTDLTMCHEFTDWEKVERFAALINKST